LRGRGDMDMYKERKRKEGGREGLREGGCLTKECEKARKGQQHGQGQQQQQLREREREKYGWTLSPCEEKILLSSHSLTFTHPCHKSLVLSP